MEGQTVKRKPGWHKENVLEPLIVEKREVTADEWALLLKLCDLTGNKVGRIVMNVSSIEYFIIED